MRVIGLTGGIASGKSTVSRALKDMGAVIIDADVIAREIVKPGEKAFESIVREFGREILKEDGTLNRKLLASIAFGDRKKLEILNKITHPEIERIIKDRIAKARESGQYYGAIVDAAMLLESGIDKYVDEVWLVYVDYDTQIQRLVERDGITSKEAEARIKSQMPVEEKIKRSHKIIDNTKDVEATLNQVKKLWREVVEYQGRESIAQKGQKRM